jgi:hypothetical protein
MLFSPAALPLSRQTLDYTAGLIRCHRRQIGSPWRKLNPGRQIIGLELADVAVDGCMTKAPCGGQRAGPSPVDRRKGGLKRSVATDGYGIPLGPRSTSTVPRRVNHQDRVMTAHLPGGEARFVAEGSHGHESAPGNTRRSEAPLNPARFFYMSKEESGGIPNGITTCGRK